jgi:hypothetical protein
MSDSIEMDFAEMGSKLAFYLDKGRLASAHEVKEAPTLSVRPDFSLIKPLRKQANFEGSFLAVDCSTRTIKRANNWGIYLMRPAYAIVRRRVVDWGFKERIYTVVGDARTRSNFLTDVRIELESQMALELLTPKAGKQYYEYGDPRSNYLLLDGGGYFGGERKFRVSLYDKCQEEKLTLLAICKNSPALLDEKGRDFIANVSSLSNRDLWVYHPARKADKDKALYGDIAIVKLCPESPHAFRCDIMDYLVDQNVADLISPLTCISEDPRCLGYPIALFLAHEFSGPSDSMLLSYHDRIEQKLAADGLLEMLKGEERASSFADEIHGVKHAYSWEYWNDQF